MFKSAPSTLQSLPLITICLLLDTCCHMPPHFVITHFFCHIFFYKNKGFYKPTSTRIFTHYNLKALFGPIFFYSCFFFFRGSFLFHWRHPFFPFLFFFPFPFTGFCVGYPVINGSSCVSGLSSSLRCHCGPVCLHEDATPFFFAGSVMIFNH